MWGKGATLSGRSASGTEPVQFTANIDGCSEPAAPGRAALRRSTADYLAFNVAVRDRFLIRSNGRSIRHAARTVL